MVLGRSNSHTNRRAPGIRGMQAAWARVRPQEIRRQERETGAPGPRNAGGGGDRAGKNSMRGAEGGVVGRVFFGN